MKDIEAKTLAIATAKSFVLGWGMIALFVVFNALGSTIIKNQIQNMGSWHFGTIRSVLYYFLTLFSSWKTWAGLFCVGMGTGTWIIALAHLELSRAYPIAIGFNLLVIVTLSIFHFHEPLTFSKLVGTFLIFAGVVFIFR